MANLPAKTIAQFVSDFAAAAQASSNTLIDFSTGSIPLAIAEASADEGAFLQGLIAYVMTLRWLSSSFGGDVDSWTADWMPGAVGGTVLPNGAVSPRLPAVSATGQVTFSRVNTSVTATVPVGTSISTQDGTQVFTVYADPTNGAYSASAPVPPGFGPGGYTVATSVATVNVPVSANTPGTGGNIAASTLTLVQSAVQMDSVSNASPFTNGLNEETDAALKLRFVLFIGALAKATDAAIGYAIVSLQQGLQYAIHENVDSNSATDYGMVTIYVDDGSGSPAGSLVTAAAAAVNAVRAAGVRTAVYAPSVVTTPASMTVTAAPGFNHSVLAPIVASTLAAYINGIGLESTLYYTEIIHQAYLVPGVASVENALLNGGTSDIVPTMGQVVRAGTITVN